MEGPCMELRCHNCQEYGNILDKRSLIHAAPQCNEVVSLANPSGSHDKSVLNQ